MQIVVDNLMTNYDMTGQGQSVLLLHGWGDSHLTFKNLQAQLSKNYQVISLDLPGFGQTEAPKETWGLENYSVFVADFLKKLNISNLHGLIGHSNGGALSIKAAADGALQPEKLILLAASGIRNKQKGKRFVIKIIAKVGKVLTFWLPQAKKKKLQEKLYGTVGSDMLVAPHLQETFKKTVAQDVQKDAAKISAPTLLIYAAQDKAVPVEDGQTFHKLIKDSKLEIVDNAEHFVHHDQAARVDQLVVEFLK